MNEIQDRIVFGYMFSSFFFFRRNREMENINKVSISWVGNFSSPIIEFVKTLPAFPQSVVAMSPARHNFTLSNHLKQLLFPVFPPSHFFIAQSFMHSVFLCVWHLSLLCYTFCRWLPCPLHLTSDCILKRISDKSYLTLPLSLWAFFGR